MHTSGDVSIQVASGQVSALERALEAEKAAHLDTKFSCDVTQVGVYWTTTTATS